MRNISEMREDVRPGPSPYTKDQKQLGCGVEPTKQN